LLQKRSWNFCYSNESNKSCWIADLTDQLLPSHPITESNYQDSRKILSAVPAFVETDCITSKAKLFPSPKLEILVQQSRNFFMKQRET
jgi:hypothetical protein